MTAPTGRTYKLGAVLPHVKRAAELVGNLYGVETILGWRASAIDKKGHPAGLALDFMVDRSTGDQVNRYLLDNAAALGVTYTIWQQQYWKPGQAPEPMEDRGSPTQNHLDHVHGNFRVLGGDGTRPPEAENAAGDDDGGALNPFGGWAGDLVGIGVKLAATGAALALIVTGVRKSATASKGTP